MENPDDRVYAAEKIMKKRVRSVSFGGQAVAIFAQLPVPGCFVFFFSFIRWKLSRRTSSPLPPSGLLRFTFFALPFPLRPSPHPCFWHCLCLFVCQFAVFRVWFGFSVFLLRHAPVQAAAGSGHPRAPPASEPSSELNCRYAIRFSGGNSGNILLKIQHRQFS